MDRFYATTETVRAEHRAIYWKELLRQPEFGVDFSCDKEEVFTGSIVQSSFGGVRAVVIDSSSMRASWQRRAILASGEPFFDLLHVRSGSLQLDHYGRSLSVETGDFVLVDGSASYDIQTLGCKTVCVRMPRDWLRQHIANPEVHAAQLLTRSSPWFAAVSGLVSGVVIATLDNSAIDVAAADGLGALLSLATEGGEQQFRRGSHRLLIRLRECMAANHSDSGTTPAKVAAECGISLRWLHAVFADAGTTFGRDLLQIRIDRTIRMLRNPRFNDISVRDIAVRCGFSDPSHFARRFREVTGQSPTAFRCGPRQ